MVVPYQEAEPQPEIHVNCSTAQAHYRFANYVSYFPQVGKSTEGHEESRAAVQTTSNKEGPFQSSALQHKRRAILDV